MAHTVVLTRATLKKVNDAKIKDQIDFLIGRALGGSRGRGWTFSISRAEEPISRGNKWVFSRKITFKKTSGHDRAEDKQWQSIVAFLKKTGEGAKFGSAPWKIEGLSGAPILTDSEKPDSEKTYGEVQTDPGNYFEHIYDRDSPIKIIHGAILAAKHSDFTNRFNCVLFGPPGCGKSELLLSTGKMLGPEGEAYIKIDATSTTEAGILKLLFDLPVVPPVLIVEEIEKADEKALRWLLGVADTRGEIRKTNFRIGHQAKNVKMLVLATANDMELFQRLMFGALASRFPNKIHCSRPSRAILRKILEREVKVVNGKTEWIEPTLVFCNDLLQWDDPRTLIPICLCGGDSLLDGSYQKAVLDTVDPAVLKNLEVSLDAVHQKVLRNLELFDPRSN